MEETVEFNQQEQEALLYFNNLKTQYSTDRQPYEWGWKQALSAVYGSSQTGTEKLDKVYDGLANIESPIMNIKVNGIVARKNRILIQEPIGRIENSLVAGPQKRDLTDLWNSYIFDFQLEQINFIQAYKLFQKNKSIQGSAFAHISQEFEEKEFSYFDLEEDEEPEMITIKDDTFWRNLLIEEFYSDVTKSDINESQMCSYSRAVSFESLKVDEKRMVTDTFELAERQLDGQGNIIGETVVGEEEVEREVGLYHNLELLETFDGNATPEQVEYTQWLGLNKGNTAKFLKSCKETKKTGFVQLDECYGLYPLGDDGKLIEVICTIANGRVIIRFEPTPFKHKKYVRPFIRGVEKPIPNCLYGESNVILGLNQLQELNASRSQASDAKTFSIFPMTYIDTTKGTLDKWDRQIRPRGIVEGSGPKGIDFIVQPYLGTIAIQDSQIIQEDLNQLFSLSPVQQGSSNRNQIPDTARGTQAIIAQTDMPLNEIINNAINNELKPFITMLFERNIAFKDVGDLLKVWTKEQIQKAGLEIVGEGEDATLVDDKGEEITMKELLIDISVKILGNLELSNEVARQIGWEKFLGYAQTNPEVARRTDFKFAVNKLIEAYGIKDDAEGLFFDDEVVAEISQEQLESDKQALEQEAAKQEEQRTKGKEDYKFKVETDTESDIVVQQVKNMGKITEDKAEALIEKATGQKVA